MHPLRSTLDIILWEASFDLHSVPPPDWNGSPASCVPHGKALSVILLNPWSFSPLCVTFSEVTSLALCLWTPYIMDCVFLLLWVPSSNPKGILKGSSALKLWWLLFDESVGPDLGVFQEIKKLGSVGIAVVGRVGTRVSPSAACRLLPLVILVCCGNAPLTVRTRLGGREPLPARLLRGSQQLSIHRMDFGSRKTLSNLR